jgi:endonuclease-3
MTKKQLYRRVIEYFEKTMPFPTTELHYKNPYELTVAVMLSAQCTDVRVNKITPAFFNKYPDFHSLSNAKQEEVYDLIKSCSYPNNKAKHLIKAAQVIENEFNGVLPDNIADLQKLPGIGRKSANVLVSIIYDKPAIAVDTHVFRVANRLGLAKAKTPLGVEKQLTEGFPKEILPKAHHWLILHGRYVCKSKKPECNKCGLKDICNYYKTSKTKENVENK